MIVVDASAIVAVIRREDGFERVVSALVAADEKRICAVSWVELTMVLSRYYSDPVTTVDAYLRHTAIEMHIIDGDQANWARYAFLTYGKGRHPARLNLGDCFSYAAAKALNAPLLFVGSDFSKTDIRAA